MADRAARGDGLLQRLWRHLADVAEAIDVSETSLLADRIEAIERRLNEMDQRIVAFPDPSPTPRPSND